MENAAATLSQAEKVRRLTDFQKYWLWKFIFFWQFSEMIFRWNVRLRTWFWCGNIFHRTKNQVRRRTFHLKTWLTKEFLFFLQKQAKTFILGRNWPFAAWASKYSNKIGGFGRNAAKCPSSRILSYPLCWRYHPYGEL